MPPPAQDPAARLRNVLEALLMAADRPLEARVLQAMLADHSPPPNQEQLCSALRGLQEDYAERGVTLRRVAGGYRFQVGADYASWVHRLERVRQPRYSRAVLETLAIIVYRQPVTRGEIERIRGITVNTGVLRILLDRRWVRVVGHKEVPGRPELLATTREFLDYFNLRSLGELPQLPAAPELPEALELPLEEEGEPTPGEPTAEGAEGGALPGSLIAEDAGDEVEPPSQVDGGPSDGGPADEGPVDEGAGGEVAVVTVSPEEASPEEASPEEAAPVFTGEATGAGAVEAEAAVGLVAESGRSAESERSAESSGDRAAAAGGVVPLVEPATSIPPSETFESGLLLGEEKDGLHGAKRVPGEDGVAD